VLASKLRLGKNPPRTMSSAFEVVVECNRYVTGESEITRLDDVVLVDADRHDLFLAVVSVLLQGDLDPLPKEVVAYLIFPIGACIVAVLVFVSVALTLLPCWIVRCCCCRRACRHREEFVMTGYPRHTCWGWQTPCCWWSMFWFVCMLTILILLATASAMALLLENILCEFNMTLDTTANFLGTELPLEVTAGTTAAGNTLGRTFTSSVAQLQVLSALFTAVEQNVTALANQASDDCASLQAQFTATGISFDCSSVDAALQVVEDAAGSVRDEVSSVDNVADTMRDIYDDVDGYLGSVDSSLAPLVDIAAEVRATQLEFLAGYYAASAAVSNITAATQDAAESVDVQLAVDRLSVAQTLETVVVAVSAVAFTLYSLWGIITALYGLKFKCCNSRMKQVKYTHCVSVFNKVGGICASPKRQLLPAPLNCVRSGAVWHRGLRRVAFAVAICSALVCLPRACLRMCGRIRLVYVLGATTTAASTTTTTTITTTTTTTTTDTRMRMHTCVHVPTSPSYCLCGATVCVRHTPFVTLPGCPLSSPPLPGALYRPRSSPSLEDPMGHHLRGSPGLLRRGGGPGPVLPDCGRPVHCAGAVADRWPLRAAASV
jgi:hypothetical protein